MNPLTIIIDQLYVQYVVTYVDILMMLQFFNYIYTTHVLYVSEHASHCSLFTVWSKLLSMLS